MLDIVFGTPSEFRNNGLPTSLGKEPVEGLGNSLLNECASNPVAALWAVPPGIPLIAASALQSMRLPAQLRYPVQVSR